MTMSSSQGMDNLYSSVMMRDVSSTLGRWELVLLTSALSLNMLLAVLSATGPDKKA